MYDIVPADLDDVRFRDFLQAHLDDLSPTAPPESRHALNLDGLRAPGVRVWAAIADGVVIGSVALAPLAEAGAEANTAWGSGSEVELKSMRADPARRGQGLGAALLEHALADARAQGAARIFLETGSAEFFVPARGLYRRFGFTECAPFGAYVADPNSVFLVRELD